MNTPKQPEERLGIKAKYIGPIMELDGELSARGQNLLFATSGTGKSFISRALRVLGNSSHEKEGDTPNPADIVSEEGNPGELTLLKGANVIAKLNFDKETGKIEYSASEYIFHVFSSDYVNAELARRAYELDGNIDHEIILGKENKELQDDEEELAKLDARRSSLKKDLEDRFYEEKSALRQRLHIRANLSAFRDLSITKCLSLEGRPENFQSNVDIKSKFDALRAIPDEPKKPQLPPAPVVDLDFDALSELLLRQIDRSTVAEEFKRRIQEDRDFFDSGVRHYHENPEVCPFCTQSISDKAKAAIDAYVSYFNDAEAETQKLIAKYKQQCVAIKQRIKSYEAAVNQAIIDYDSLKSAFSSVSASNLNAVNESCGVLDAQISKIEALLDEKSVDLTQIIEMDESINVKNELKKLSEISIADDKKVRRLNLLVDDSTSERLALQRQGCTSFEYEFVDSHEAEINEISDLDNQINILLREIERLRKSSGETIKAREKVADTLEELINFVFAGRYTFHKHTFTVQRNKKAMSRGSDRTLSDGEKTILAFCYFVAQSHLKVADVDDYRKLYLIVDDPVSSVSFDYVYCICQILKTLRIEGSDLKINTDGSIRPNILILTHHDFFYNVVLNNNVVHQTSLFQLVSRGETHEILNQKEFVAPHKFHLDHIVGIATAVDTVNPSTPNAVRSVLEGIWRFAYPNLNDLQAFISKVSSDQKVQIRSVLIQDMSHGGKMWMESPLSADIETACKEAIEIVRYCAPGQVAGVPVFEEVLISTYE